MPRYIHRHPVSSTLFKIVSVTLHGKNGTVTTYAFLDDGASVTLVERTIANEQRIKKNSRAHSLCIHWTSGINKIIESTELEQLNMSEPGSQAEIFQALGNKHRREAGITGTIIGLRAAEQRVQTLTTSTGQELPEDRSETANRIK